MFPILDRRKCRRRVDKLGRPQPVYGDRRAPATSFLGDKLRLALRHVGIGRRITIHGLRRTFAVLLQESGRAGFDHQPGPGPWVRARVTDGALSAPTRPRRDALRRCHLGGDPGAGIGVDGSGSGAGVVGGGCGQRRSSILSYCHRLRMAIATNLPPIGWQSNHPVYIRPLRRRHGAGKVQ